MEMTTAMSLSNKRQILLSAYGKETYRLKRLSFPTRSMTSCCGVRGCADTRPRGISSIGSWQSRSSAFSLSRSAARDTHHNDEHWATCVRVSRIVRKKILDGV